MIFTDHNISDVYKILRPILLVSKLAAVCTVRKGKNNELELWKVLYVVQFFILIICILHLGYIPYAVIYIEKVCKQNHISQGKSMTKTVAFLSKKNHTLQGILVVYITGNYFHFLDNSIWFANYIHFCGKQIFINEKLIIEIKWNTICYITNKASNSCHRFPFPFLWLMFIICWPYITDSRGTLQYNIDSTVQQTSACNNSIPLTSSARNNKTRLLSMKNMLVAGSLELHCLCWHL